MKRAALLALASALVGCGGGDDRPSREETRSCLERLDLHVTPWERPPNDDDGPYAMLDANDVLRGRLRVEAQYYATSRKRSATSRRSGASDAPTTGPSSATAR